MLKNYLLVAWRQISRNKLFSGLNIFGLATSMSVCLLLILIVEDQYSYDTFHTNGDHIYRVISAKSEGAIVPQKARLATTAMSLAEPLSSDYNFIERATLLVPVEGFFKKDGIELPGTDGGLVVEQDFLNIFSFGWLQGDAVTALTQPRSVILTQETAEKFFPGQNPVGEELIVDVMGSFTVTGVIPDPPMRSHIQFDYLLSYATIETLNPDLREAISIYDMDDVYRGLVYVQLSDDASAARLDQALVSQAQSYSQRDGESHYVFESQALRDVVPSRDLGNEIGVGTPRMVLYFLLALGLIIIVTACFNYTNLSIARSLKRAREIGIRKVNGARKRDIALQFMSEAVLISLFALVVAIGLLELLIPAFYQLDPFVSSVFLLERSLGIYGLFFIFSLVVGIVAGLLPSLNIARFQPIQALGQLQHIKLFSQFGLRKLLVTIQFALSLIFILMVIIVLQQQKYVLHADLGLKTENMLVVRMNSLEYDLLVPELAKLPEVELISGSDQVLLTGQNAKVMAAYHEGADSLQLAYNHVSGNYCENLEIELLAGQSFPENGNTQREQFVIINEQASKRMGFATPQTAIGQSITIDTLALSIIGVTEDFHHDNIWFEPIQPFAFRQKTGSFRNANIQLSDNYSSETFTEIKEIWNRLSPDQPIFSFLVSDRIYHMTKFFRMGSQIIGFIGLLTIVISCLGLLGMVIYATESRIKEVGIRKVLGASPADIIWKLSKSFLFLLGVAVLIGLPITLIVANLWLQNFFLRIQIGIGIPLLGIAFLLSLGMLTVLSQTYLAARRNPVERDRKSVV